jgi:hypothetical protein
VSTVTANDASYLVELACKTVDFTNLFPLDNQISNCCVADVPHLVPFNPVAREAASRRQIDFSYSGAVGDLHAPTLDRVTEMRDVEMALMAGTGRKLTSQNSLIRIFVQ